jgi:hypothetical protein
MSPGRVEGDGALLARVSEALRPVRGMVALVLGGSRGRGTAGPASDYDIGLYYEPGTPLDVEELQRAMAPLVDAPSSAVTRIGEWGPWINCGGWLTIGASWMGEIATCRPLWDPSGRIAELKNETWPYPEALRDALIARFGWEVGFAISNAEGAALRDELTHVAGCAYRALCCMAQTEIWSHIGNADAGSALHRLRGLAGGMGVLVEQAARKA